MADNLEFGVDLRFDIGQIAGTVNRIAQQFDQLLNTNQKVARSFDSIGASQAKAFNQAGESIGRATRATRNFDAVAEELANDLKAVAATAQATEATLSKVGADPQLFAVARRELERVLQLQTKFEADFERISKDGNLLRSYVSQFEQIRTPLSKSISNLNELLRSTARDRGNIQQAENLKLRAQLQEQADIRRAARGQFVAITQQETTLRNAEIRTQGQLQLQTDRRVARTRIEILRFTLAQVRVFERAIGSVFRGTATLIQGAYSRIEGSVARLGQVFRRSNRSLDDGLQGALTSRERSIRRSFQRQTSDVNIAINQQSAQIDRLERKLSTGVFGAASGRSRLGGALGIGGIIGGGVGARSLLTSGFERFANLERITVQLERLTGSAEEGARLMAEIDAFARTTPLALDTIAQLGVGFLSMGVAAEQVVPNVNAIADAVGFAGGGAEQLERISLALRQIASTGKLQGDEFNQLAENLPGLNINQLLADQLTGGNQAALVELRESGELTSDIFLEAFIAGLTEDPRIAGSMTDIADQLQGQVSNLKAAWARLGATIIDEAQVPIRFGIAALKRLFSDLAKFISGDVSPQLQIFRQALIGVAGALGLLLAAKVAAESVQLLGVALRFALTPMGLLVVAVATIGAALRIFSTSSESAADTLRSIAGAARDLGGQGLLFLIRGFERLAQVITTELYPILQPLAEIVGNSLFRALEVSIGFIVLVAIPAFARLGSAIADDFLPAVQAVGGVLQRTVVPALAAFASVALSVLSTVVRFLQPAIDGFLNLGAAIIDAFANRDFGGLLDGLQSVARGIATVFSNLGVLLYDAIRPQVERAVGFIVTAFQNINFEAIGRKILEIVRLVGFILGSIVSDPRFITALAAIAAAAVLLVANFVRGFAEGVASNIPELGGLLGDAVLAAFRVAFSDLGRLSTVVAAALVTVLASRAVISVWSRAGEAGAGGLARGFATRLAATPDLLAGLFGGSGALERRAQEAAKRASRALVKEFQRSNRELAALGQTPTFNPKGGITAQAVKDVNQRLAETKTRLTEAGSAAVLFRDRASRAFTGVGEIATGTFRALSRRSTAELRTVEVGFKRLGLVAGDSLNALRSNLAARGVTGGQALGAGVLAGFGAYISGQQGGAIGIAGILASSLSVAAISPAIAAATAAIGGVTFFLNRNKDAAREAAQEIETYLDVLSRFRTDALAAADLGQLIARAVGDASTGALELLAEAGIDVTSFAREAVAGSRTAFDTVAELATGLGVGADALEDFRGQIRSFSNAGVIFAFNNDEGQKFRDELERSGVSVDDFAAALETLLGESGSIFEAGRRSDALRALAPDAELGTRAAAQLEEQMNRTSRSFDEAGLSLADVRAPISQIVDGFDELGQAVQGVGGAAEGGAGRFVRAFGSVADAAQAFLADIDIQRAFDFDLSAFLDSLQIGVDQNSFAFDRIGIAVGSLNQNLRETEKIKIDPLDIDGDDEPTKKVDLLSAAIQELNSRRTTALRAEIEGVRSRLDEATAAADKAREALTAFITGRYADTAQSQVDSLIGDIGNIGSKIEEALLQGGVRGEAALRSAVGGFESQLAGIIQAGFDDGLRTQDEFRNLLDPLFAAAGEETGDFASRILSTVDFEEGFTPAASRTLTDALNRVLGGNKLEVGVQGILDAQANQDAIQAQLDQMENQLNVEVVVTPSQVQAALTQAFNEAGVSLDLLPNIDAAAIAAAQQTGLTGTVTEFAAQQDVEQNNSITINVNGSKDPPATTADVMDVLNAGVVGFPLPSFSTGTRIATGRSTVPSSRFTPV